MGKDLDKLIETCKSRKMATIKHQDLLISSLESLRDKVIGMENVKDSMAEQIIFLISEPNTKTPPMLHTMIYGPPGVGKSTIGKHLAEIWYALGYLKTTASAPVEIKAKPPVKSEDNDEVISMAILVLIVAYVALILASEVASRVSKMMGVIVFTAIILGFLMLYYSKIKSLYNNYKSEKAMIDIPESKVEKAKKKDESMFVVVTREDLVGQYVGHTAPKTRKLLDENRGKVIFVDEAYSLYSGSKNDFGVEALTTMNAYVTEHPGEVILIFAGYQNEMAKLFIAQPGLERRFTWKLECSGYNPEELYKIFKVQLQKDDLKIKDEKGVKKLISDHYGTFKAFAGDTEKLCYFSRIEKAKENFHAFKKGKDLETVHIESGIKKMKQNEMKDTSAPKEDDASKLRDILGKMNL